MTLDQGPDPNPIITVRIKDSEDRVALPGWKEWTADQPYQVHGVVPGLEDVHGTPNSTSTTAMGIVGVPMYNAHRHGISEEWPVHKKNLVAEHIETHHPRKGKSCRSCRTFVLVGEEHFCPPR